MDRIGDRRLQLRQRRQRRVQLRLRARRVELGAAAGIETRLDDAQRLALIIGIALRHVVLRLRAAQLEIIARDFGDDAHLHAAQIGLDRLFVRLARFDFAAHTAPQIDFPKRIDATGGQFRRMRGAVERLIGADARLGVRRLHRHRRQQIVLTLVAQRARLIQIRERDAQIVIALQREADESVERAVTEYAPELRDGRVTSVRHIVGRIRVRRFRDRTLVIGADRAARDDRG